jgi:hypothetical protein
MVDRGFIGFGLLLMFALPVWAFELQSLHWPIRRWRAFRLRGGSSLLTAISATFSAPTGQR